MPPEPGRVSATDDGGEQHDVDVRVALAHVRSKREPPFGTEPPNETCESRPRNARAHQPDGELGDMLGEASMLHSKELRSGHIGRARRRDDDGAQRRSRRRFMPLA